MENFSKNIKELNIDDHYKNMYVRPTLEEVVSKVISMQNRNKSLSEIDHYFIKQFRSLEHIGWVITDSHEILKLWYKIGRSLGINKVEEKLNSFKPEPSKEQKIQQLQQLKSNKKINAEIPKFYSDMRRSMDISIDNVIEQLKKSDRIDEVLEVFSNDMEMFLELQEGEFTFNDTEDRETIGEFYNSIIEILNFEYSRGLIIQKLISYKLTHNKQLRSMIRLGKATIFGIY